jgi:hypothetical protein
MTSALGRIIFGMTTAVLLIPPSLRAQQPAPAAPAPVPPQVAHAKRVFIINAEGTNDPRVTKYIGGANGIYNQFYANVKNTGRFQPASDPAEADVALEVTLSIYDLIPSARFKLAILDPKTNLLLWTISEPLEGAVLTKTAQKNIAQSLARLTQDLVMVAASQ